ncbi:unnamed protein product [Penicillium egyptiacum]|uniref:Uncharacterized protein n=1 Tax=Penicillium egyptiacum TaxID=1303716 RepID=A0A9W4P372_9EURO|nr:unnamed protein product [Penicillium egyptiacum]
MLAKPPSLGGSVISNTYQYMTDMHGFLRRDASARRKNRIVKFQLGPKKIYMVSEEKNIQTINRSSNGHEVNPGQARLGHGQHHVYSQYLQRTDHANALSDKYMELFNQRLSKQPLGEWRKVRLSDFFRRKMAEAALIALMGSRVVELNPDFWPATWGFARLAPQLMWGFAPMDGSQAMGDPG